MSAGRAPALSRCWRKFTSAVFSAFRPATPERSNVACSVAAAGFPLMGERVMKTTLGSAEAGISLGPGPKTHAPAARPFERHTATPPPHPNHLIPLHTPHLPLYL